MHRMLRLQFRAFGDDGRLLPIFYPQRQHWYNDRSTGRTLSCRESPRKLKYSLSITRELARWGERGSILYRNAAHAMDLTGQAAKVPKSSHLCTAAA
jgi:hypothetical protein